MSGNTDFIALFQELGLNADCSLEELKLAYRKRVGALHPDRLPDAPENHELQRLNSMYSAAIHFQRRHGRLPGAAPAISMHASAQSEPRTAPQPTYTENRQRSVLRPIIAISLFMLLGLWGANEFMGQEAVTTLPHNDAAGMMDVAPSDDANRAMNVAQVESATRAQALQLGASAQHVRSIHGVPVSGSELRWEYGPSWIAFRCGEVSDWYSSPLRPLKVLTARPTASATWSPPKHCKD